MSNRGCRSRGDTWTMSMAFLRLQVLTLLLVISLHSAAAENDVTPRLTFSYDAEERTSRRFSAGGVFNFTSLLLSKEDDTMYVGAREVLFALNLSDISAAKLQRNLTWKTPERKRGECSFKGKDLQTDCFNYIKILLSVNSTHLYVCGTYAFSPICAYVNTANFSLVRTDTGEIVTEDGRSRCPFNPEYKSTAIMADGELYAGTVSNFQGNEPIIYKSLSQGMALKTENSLNWLQDPAFVGSAYIQESLPKGNPVGDDDKIYFFFSEAGKEFDFFDNTIVSRVARVCKGDMGGERVLQKKWTTFLKAQLLCSLPDDGFPFNIIQDMFVLTPSPGEWRKNVFYGVFTSQWYNGASGSSAVCSFTMEQVEKAFSGRYREVNRETQQWYAYNHPVPEPRPGACITNGARSQGVPSSLHMPDKVLNFVKDHFLMDSVLRSQPLLLKRHVRYTQIAVHQVRAEHKAYHVLFIGTDDGRLHKAMSVKNKMHIIEEIVLFRDSRPVQHIELDAEEGRLYVSTFSELVEVPVANCTNYQSCGECILSRDPYCAWNGRQCVDVRRAPPSNVLQQDVDNADAAAICNRTAASARFAKSAHARASTCQLITIPANTFQVLPCELRSNLAERAWAFSESSGHFHYPSPDGGLVVVAQADRRETYECWSVEEGFRQLLANYCVRGEAKRESSTQTGRTGAPAAPQEEFVILPGEARSPQINAKTYWNELIVVCALLAFSLLVFSLFVVYRHRDHMKSMLKEGECPNMQQKKPRTAAKPVENLPLNGNAAAATVTDHKGYQTLHDNYICGTPSHECPSPDNSKSFSEAEKRPQDLQDSRVEISSSSPRPRVRLGSEIKDSVV
ncbi:sema domain, immunoglobulin domain (Ig), transmembrane domain (TM) and short cytoplasmic domain, (semaphorin) 4Ba [Nerophis ophidion]|uniref:sema domain, immunoglobulin domain (Ig), transmembrane domain (TM) and short cytoplasmic domain, (semaphorin) 4Ba n=1 Tax=Nerophis ophidion TaxID=159077 RepID=UPI002AE079AD|nr:sema domain, immunoglobulin domain (Ig), transmembrane domain (TM) and short cytoplasmic domain, (semaphorin) 4Ba [Nerophis ophidion]XP_061750791.1 sema domain, immunoglobulin domain (Ig), transmembrane domain (TM) and short cytoplasmic domain, (semaphorin) 4Ba [Nerophis ophidion]XP_061750793.1 sema domain, immunoglobulin domain (Ig), transmembrane domain (TM) and short cytoplasmic domain, (semaphorin) 4Ba [Nerophis ophidion]